MWEREWRSLRMDGWWRHACSAAEKQNEDAYSVRGSMHYTDHLVLLLMSTSGSWLTIHNNGTNG
jgi:hypothetical protein